MIDPRWSRPADEKVEWDFFDQSGSATFYVPWLWFWIVLGMMWFICAVALPSKPWWAGREGREPCGAGCVMFERQEYPPQTEWHCHKPSGNRSFPAK